MTSSQTIKNRRLKDGSWAGFFLKKKSEAKNCIEFAENQISRFSKTEKAKFSRGSFEKQVKNLPAWRKTIPLSIRKEY